MTCAKFTFVLAGLCFLIAPGCASQPDTANPELAAEPAEQPRTELTEQEQKAKEAAKQRARLEALPPLPGVEKPSPVDFPDPAIRQLDNGLELIVLEDHEVPIVDAALFIKAGEIYAPDAQPTLAQMTATLLSEGTQKHSKAEIDERIDATGGSLASQANDEVAWVQANVPTEALGLALGTMAEVVMHPSFSDSSIAKLKDNTIQSVRSQKAQPRSLAQALGRRVIYGEKSPYGRTFPTDPQIEAVTREQIEDFYQGHYVPNNAILLLTGDITPEEAFALAVRHFGKWKRGGSIRTPSAEKPAPPNEPVVHIVDRKASAQAFVAVVAAAPKAGDPGWIETQVLRDLLSGGLSTRLNFVLREQLGLTYGAGASHTYGYDGGMFWAGGSTKTKTAKEFAEALLPLVTDLAQDPLPENELRRVKNTVSGRFALEAEGVDVMAMKTLAQRIYGLPADFWSKYRAGVESVTAEDLRHAAAQSLASNHIQIIAVGRRNRLEKQLRHLGEIRGYDTDLVPIH